MIEVKDLVKSYGGHMAVDHLSFTVRDGQIYGFLGPNGAGKSTTMNIMTGYLGATSGEVLINGHNILEEPEAAKSDIGYLPEIPPLYTDMTVREYLDFAASLKKIPRATRAEAVAEAMELVKVADVNGRLIKNLSKGYRLRHQYGEEYTLQYRIQGDLTVAVIRIPLEKTGGEAYGGGNDSGGGRR